MYTIIEPYIDLQTENSLIGKVPFFHIKNENNEIVYVSVTRLECEIWIKLQK